MKGLALKSTLFGYSMLIPACKAKEHTQQTSTHTSINREQESDVVASKKKKNAFLTCKRNQTIYASTSCFSVVLLM